MRDATLTIVRLRVRWSSAELARLAAGLPGHQLGTTVEGTTALGIAPDQWILVSERHGAEEVMACYSGRLAGILHLAVDASHGLRRLRLVGPDIRKVLAMGSGLDWRMNRIPIGACRRLRFGKVAIIAHVAGPDGVDLYMDTSIERYVAAEIERARGDPLLIRTSIP